MASKFEAGGITGNRYWAEILMAKTESEAAEAAWLIFREMPFGHQNLRPIRISGNSKISLNFNF